PDFIDTGLHGLLTGRASRNLDLWMCGKEYVRGCFQRNVADADIAVIEGVMGIYDGQMSTAHLAAELGLPVILIVDAYGMAESAGAIVKGFANYGAICMDHVPTLAGVIFNRVASERHYKRVRDSVTDVPVLGYLPRNIEFNIPHRHLGLVVAEEDPIDAKEIDKLADAVLEHIDVQQIVQKSNSFPTDSPFGTNLRHGDFAIVQKQEKILVGARLPVKIAVAYDKAFCFYYEDNLDLLKEAGAEIVKFSPLSDDKLPDDIDALYIGGGYPELYAAQLSANGSMLKSVSDFVGSGMPVYAECGGFMYLTEGIYDFDGNLSPMAGIFPFKTKMTKGRMRLGYREAVLREDSILAKKGTSVRGHEFHYSEIVNSSQLTDLIYSVKDGEGHDSGIEGYRTKNTLGSYIHIHFGSERLIAKNMVDFIKEHHGTDTFSRTR
ncbi:MAG TPA: cobyrinate a,c-diamide synthase, partial [Nitrospirae bacterium]|nr:cobyrinate a,c-diamide synthase [Nitrospirota bacterium]